MSKLITRIKRLALALCFVTPLVSWAVTTTGYEDFGDTAGVVLWRGTEANFHASTVIDVAENGTLGTPYAMTADNSATAWQRFASNQSAYASPGKVLVYDTPGTDQGYKYNPNCTFGPLSFGGMWVKTLAINGLPFSILGSGDRKTEFGAADKSTLFKFDASYTINRTGTTTFYGDATVDIADGATFTAQANSSHVVEVDSAATLKLKGAGTLAVTTMAVKGTLDLSEAARPTIAGNVTLEGKIVLPAGTEVSQENPFTVCSGTLSAANAYVKIGDAEAVQKRIAVSGGAITGFSDPAYEFTENYPTVVPAGQVFTFIGGDTAESATVASGVTVNGTLKTRGYISLSGLTTAKESMLEVVDGTATVTASAAQSLTGDITIDAGATMVNATTADALNYGWGVYVHVYGTLDMGSTRWTVGSNARIYLYEGGLIAGAGQSSNGAIDITSANVRVIASGDSTISANMRVRAENIPVEATEGKTLTISGLINDGVSYSQPGSITKQNSGTLVLTTAPTFTKALKLEAGTLELGGTAASSSVTVAASAATVAASSGSTLTGELIFVSHIPSAANKALIASEAFNGAVVLTGTISSAANITGLGNEVTLRDFTGFLDKSASTSGIKVKVEGTFTQSNGWSYDADRIYLAEIKGNGTMTQSGSQAQLYEVGSIANFTGTFNLTNARIKSNNNAVLDKAQKIATLTVAKTLTVNGGSLTGNLAANDIAVTVDGTPAVGDVLVPVTGTVSVSGTVTVNGDEVEVECVTGEGVKLAASTVTITVPTVANTTITVTVGGEPVAPATQGESSNTYSVADGATVTVTYTAAEGYRLPDGVQSVYNVTADEDTSVEVSEDLVSELLVAKVRNTASSQDDEYTTLAAAVAATKDGNHNPLVTLMANVDEAEVTVDSAIMLLGNYTISSDIKVVAGGQLQLMQVKLEGKLTIEENGIYVTGGGELSELVTKDGAKIQLTTLSDTEEPLSVTTLSVAGELTIISSWGLAVRDTYYKALSYVTANADIAEGATVDSVNEWSAKVEEEGDKTVVYLAITKVAVVDGVYYDTAQEAVDAAVASGEPAQFLVQPGTVTLGAGETLIVTGAFLPTVELEDGLTTPPYSLETTPYSEVTGLTIYTVVKEVSVVPASVVISYNTYAELSVIGYDEGATFGWTMYTNGVACSSLSGPVKISGGKTKATVKVYSETTAFDNVVAKVAITNGEDVIEREATITVADVAARVGETEYTKAQLDNAIADAISSGKVLEHYFGVSTAISKGQTLKTKKLAERNGSASVRAAASTIEGEAWKIDQSAEDEDGVITWTVTTTTDVAVVYTSEDGETTEYLAADFSASKDGTYKLISDITRKTLTVTASIDMTLDLNGHTLTSTATTTSGAINFGALSGTRSLTIKDSVGGGKIVANSLPASAGYIVFARGGTTSVTIESGDFVTTSGTGAVFTKGTGCTTTITGGNFNKGVLNMDDSSRGTITVTGGTFTGFNPANNAAEGAGTNFVADGYVSTETSTGVWTVTAKPSGIDPDDPESKQEVVIDPTGKDEDQIKEAAVEEATVTVPEAVPTEAKAAITDYKSYFELKATVTNPETGACTVEIVGFKDDVVQDVNEDAVEALKDAVADTETTTVAVEVPAGLYYVVETYEALGTPVDSQEGWSTGTTTPVDKPTGTTQGFIRVRISTAEITD